MWPCCWALCWWALHQPGRTGGSIALGPSGWGADAGAGLWPPTLGRGQMCRREPVPKSGISAVVCSTWDYFFCETIPSYGSMEAAPCQIRVMEAFLCFRDAQGCIREEEANEKQWIFTPTSLSLCTNIIEGKNLRNWWKELAEEQELVEL